MNQKPTRKQCKKILKNGKRCKNAAIQGGNCRLHSEPRTGGREIVKKLIAAGMWAPAVTELMKLIEEALPYIHHVVHFRSHEGKFVDRYQTPAKDQRHELTRIQETLKRMRVEQDYRHLTKLAVRTLKVIGNQ